MYNIDDISESSFSGCVDVDFLIDDVGVDVSDDQSVDVGDEETDNEDDEVADEVADDVADNEDDEVADDVTGDLAADVAKDTGDEVVGNVVNGVAVFNLLFSHAPAIFKITQCFSVPHLIPSFINVPDHCVNSLPLLAIFKITACLSLRSNLNIGA